MKPKHYPAMDMYNDAVQHPGTAFLAPDLRQAQVATSALGLPVALGGGFALTYRLTVGGRGHAVRCFHRYVADLEERYRKIAACLAQLPGDYFVDFEYLSQGIRVQGEVYPVVRMRWAEGDTLGAFLEEHYDDPAALRWLRRQFRGLDAFLRRHGLAHGDLQNGNLIIDGQTLRVVDYDGMFVLGMKEGVGHEIGHRHFQHPDRRPEDFGPAMDRFSLIVLDVSLQALEQDKSLFHRYSNGENVLFSANDLADPRSSPLFRELLARPELKSHAEHLAAIAQADLAATPTLPEFLRGENIPAAEVRLEAAANAYLAAFPVVEARDFEAAQRHVGDRVELVGRIADVVVARNKYGRPYAVLGFAADRGRGISINIWAQGFAKLRQAPDRSWTGQWVSVTGLVDPGTVDPKLNLRHVCITVGEASQIRIVTEAEAQYRLASRGRPPVGRVARRQNQAILASLRGRRNGPSAQGPAPAGRSRGPAAPGIRANGPGAAATVPPPPPAPVDLDETTIAGIPLWVWVTAIFVSLLVLAIV